MTETKPLPTIKDLALKQVAEMKKKGIKITCPCYPPKEQYELTLFSYEEIQEVLSAHEEHYRKVIQEWVKFRAEALKKHCEEDVMMASEKVMYNLIRLEAIQGLRGTK